MKRLLTVCITVALLLPNAYSQDEDYPLISDYVHFQSLEHNSGEISMSVTSYGVLGSYAKDRFDSETGQPAVSLEYPSGLELNILYMGALWIGGVVEDTLQPGHLDTLVSIGDDGWWYDVNEFSAGDGSDEIIHREQRDADQEIVTAYYDTLIERVHPDPIDERDHLPLGLKVTQHSSSWSSRGYDEFIIVNYSIENIYDRDVSNAYIGILLDSEIGRLTNYPGGWWIGSDDLGGYLHYHDKPVVWLADNDGDPRSDGYRENSPDNVVGMMLLGFSGDETRLSYNWWISNSESEYDWGPQLQANYDIWGDFGGGGKGTPGGDISRYQLMSNGEIDYDQVYCGLDWTEAGWIENSSSPNDIEAEGHDNLCILSVGPFDLEAGSVESLTVAFVAGRSLHRNTDNFETYLEGHTEDSLSIAAYYNNLDFTALYANLDTVLAYYESGWENIPIGAPEEFRISAWNTNSIKLSWQAHGHRMLNGYNIYRGTEPGSYEPVPITPESYNDTMFVDYDVSDNTTYYYIIRSENISGIEGGLSGEISINTGQPQTPSGLNIIAGNRRVDLEWLPNSDDDLAGYIIMSSSSHQDTFAVLDTVLTNSYSESNLLNGVKYYYKVLAIDEYSNVSFASDSIHAIPMAFDSGIMFINANRSEWSYNPDYDSMLVFYEQILEGYPHMIAYECPEDLSQLSPYSTIIWCKELIAGRFYFEAPLQDYRDLFADYLDAGGQLILAGTRISSRLNSNYPREFYEEEFQRKYLNLLSISYPEYINNEFLGGFGISEDYPDFFVDTEKANRMTWPEPNETGRLFGVGAFEPADTSEVIYYFNAVSPDTSDLHIRPIGLIHATDTFKVALLEFPLYYMDNLAANEFIDNLLNQFETRVEIVDFNAPIPEIVDLMQNYPNPFNYRTEIRYFLPADMRVRLEVFDILGRSIITLVDEQQSGGLHSVSWDGKNSEGVPATSGIYFYRLTTGESITARRMVYLK